MEQGKKKLISGADEFVEARKAQLEKEQQKQEKAQGEKSAEEDEFHKTQAFHAEQSQQHEAQMVSERARLHGEQQQRREQHDC